ncbi:hypothetical protein M0P48_00490 [Candidatus Gracilibacteria bacterium]|jgi:hypothetical protein|nr:hypothetical protein [Candidatus Gracilibacteria bacterium]
MIPRFNDGEMTAGEWEDWKEIQGLSPEQLAKLSIEQGWFQPGQFVGSPRLRLTRAGLARIRLDRTTATDEANALIQQAKATRDRMHSTLSAV